MGQFKSFLLKCKRVWSILKKPTKEEFKMTSKVAGIGIAILGAIGFLVSLVMNVFS